MSAGRPQNQNDVPLPIAAFALVAVGVAYSYLTYFRFHQAKLRLLRVLFEQHSDFWCVSICAVIVNLAFLGIYIRRSIGLERQGSKLDVLKGERRNWKAGRADIVSALTSVLVYLSMRGMIKHELVPPLAKIMPATTVFWIEIGLSVNISMFALIVTRNSKTACEPGSSQRVRRS